MRYFWLGYVLLAGLLGACSAPGNPAATKLTRIRWTRDPENLSPIAMPNQNATDAANLLYCGLLQVDFARGNYAPALADTLPTVQLVGDSLTYLSYHLRPEAAWDDGRPVVAADVDFTLKLMQCPGLPNEGTRTRFSFIRSLLADSADPRRFTLVCRGQAPEYINASGDFPVLPEATLDPAQTLRRFSLAALQDHSAETPLEPALAALVRRYEQADPAHHPWRLPGCGPYVLADWETNRALIFQRKKHWWADRLKPAPFVLRALPQQIQFLVIPDDATATLALRRHELDVYPQVPAREFERLQASAQQELAFYSVPSYDIVVAGFNTRRPVLHDKLTRQALSCLFDPVRLLQATQLGQGRRTVGLVNPLEQHYYYDSLPLPAYNPDRARRLLQRAGWQRQAAGWQRQAAARPSEQLSLVLRYRAGDTTFETIALQFKAAAAVLGIPVELRPTEPSTLTTNLRQGNFDIYVRALKGGPEAFNFIPILHSQSIGEGNFTGFGSLTTDNFLEIMAATGEPKRKQHLLRRFQLMMQDEMPLVPLFVLPYRLAANRQLRGLHPSSLRPGYSAAALDWSPAVTSTFSSQ